MQDSGEVPVTRNRVRGSARGMGVDWSTVAEKAFAPRSAAEPSRINLKKLFRSWDTDGDGMLSILEICWGIRRAPSDTGSYVEQMLPPLMLARIIKRLEVITTEDKNPDWQFLDMKAFQELLFTAVPDEAADNDAFLTKYSDLELLEKILPQDSLERSPDVETTEKSKKKRRRKKKGDKKKKKDEGTKSRIVRVFESWDTDNDGTLSVQEIKNALAQEDSQVNGEDNSSVRESLLKPGEMSEVKKYIADLEASGETLGWLYLDPAEFQEIVWG